MSGYENLHRLLDREIVQRTEEGCPVDLPHWIERLRICNPRSRDALEEMYDELAALRPRDGFPFSEISDLEAIRNARPNGVRYMEEKLEDREIFERIHGGWLGRCCGCTLGKPFSVKPYTENKENRQRQDIRFWLDKTDAWPLDDYVPATSPAEHWKFAIAAPECTRNNVKRMETDENINAGLTALKNLEENGTGFRTRDLAATWLGLLAYDQTSPAVAQALANIIAEDRFARNNRSAEDLDEIDWTRIAERRNPYREWNDAMSRAALYGFAAPGKPEFAAEMAWRDASASHVKNGVYAAMFFAALTAAAFHERHIPTLVEIALSEIPPKSRLVRAIRKLLTLREQYNLWTASWDKIIEEYGHYHVRHAIPATLMCLLPLLYGDGDFERSITLAVCCGRDPAGNGAAVGSVVGVLNGSRALPGKWVKCLNNTLRSDIRGFTEITISDCARRTAQVLFKEA